MAFFFGYFTVLHDIPNKYKGDFFCLRETSRLICSGIPINWFLYDCCTGFRWVSYQYFGSDDA